MHSTKLNRHAVFFSIVLGACTNFPADDGSTSEVLDLVEADSQPDTGATDSEVSSFDTDTSVDTCHADQPARNCPCSFKQLPDPDYPYCCVGTSLTGWLCDPPMWAGFEQSCEVWNETCPYCPRCPEGWTL